MNTMEKNRQVVQDWLDKRKAKRKRALTEAEQDAITMQIINIVNTNACNAKTQRQMHQNWNNLTYDDPEAWKELSKNLASNKKTIWLDRLLMVASCAGLVAAITFMLMYLL